MKDYEFYDNHVYEMFIIYSCMTGFINYFIILYNEKL